MQNSISVLTKKAIDASLKANWQDAVKINTEILEKNPKDLDAKIRLGRALIQLCEFAPAKVIFKEVLAVDPINSVAIKNLKLASEKKTEKYSSNINPKSLIKEPGTTAEITLDLTDKKVSAEVFCPGEEIGMKVKRSTVEFFKVDQHKGMISLGEVNSNLHCKINLAKERGGTVTAIFSSGNGKRVKILIKSTVPVFRGERQEVRPYIKRGSIEEPELEMLVEYEE